MNKERKLKTILKESKNEIEIDKTKKAGTCSTHPNVLLTLSLSLSLSLFPLIALVTTRRRLLAETRVLRPNLAMGAAAGDRARVRPLSRPFSRRKKENF